MKEQKSQSETRTSWWWDSDACIWTVQICINRFWGEPKLLSSWLWVHEYKWTELFDLRETPQNVSFERSLSNLCNMRYPIFFGNQMKINVEKKETFSENEDEDPSKDRLHSLSINEPSVKSRGQKVWNKPPPFLGKFWHANSFPSSRNSSIFPAERQEN